MPRRNKQLQRRNRRRPSSGRFTIITDQIGGINKINAMATVDLGSTEMPTDRPFTPLRVEVQLAAYTIEGGVTAGVSFNELVQIVLYGADGSLVATTGPRMVGIQPTTFRLAWPRMTPVWDPKETTPTRKLYRIQTLCQKTPPASTDPRAVRWLAKVYLRIDLEVYKGGCPSLNHPDDGEAEDETEMLSGRFSELGL